MTLLLTLQHCYVKPMLFIVKLVFVLNQLTGTFTCLDFHTQTFRASDGHAHLHLCPTLRSFFFFFLLL